MEFLTGYLIEKALSVDNLFVFIIIFSYFSVPRAYKHKVLFWGIVGALIMRAIFIAIGALLLAQYHWIIYPFGVFLIATSIKLVFKHSSDIKPENNLLLKLMKRFMRVTDTYHGEVFWVTKAGKLYATPLFLVLVIVEFTDLVFAVDSIPAIFAITADLFIVYSSNIFAMIGLRSLYFALASIMDKFQYLRIGLALVLAFIGSKMLISGLFKIPSFISLVVVVMLIGLSIVASLLFARVKS